MSNLVETELSFGQMLSQAVHYAQCAYELISSDVYNSPTKYEDMDWIYDVEWIELRGKRLYDLVAGFCSLRDMLDFDMEKEVMQLVNFSETYVLKMQELAKGLKYD
jgi:hypothetical protein